MPGWQPRRGPVAFPEGARKGRARACARALRAPRRACAELSMGSRGAAVRRGHARRLPAARAAHAHRAALWAAQPGAGVRRARQEEVSRIAAEAQGREGAAPKEEPRLLKESFGPRRVQISSLPRDDVRKAKYDERSKLFGFLPPPHFLSRGSLVQFSESQVSVGCAAF